MPASRATLDGIDREAILARFANNLPRNLAVVATALNQRLVLACTEQGFAGVRTSFVHALFQLRSEKKRLVDVAQYCGLSQQAVGLIANEMEQLGYLKCQPDLDDGRAKRLLPTRSGSKLLACAEEACARTDAELSQLIGSELLSDFKTSCTRLFEALVAPDAGSALSVVALPLYLTGLATFCERRALTELGSAPGYKKLKMSYAQVLKYMSPHGTLITDLARINDVSKQAISQVVKQVEELGYVQRRQHPGDGRSTMIFLTDSGLRLIRDSLDNVGKIEADFARVLGKRGTRRFTETAEQLLRATGTGAFRFDGGNGDGSTESLLHQVMERLYLDCGEAARARLFIRAGAKTKLSSSTLRMLDSLELRIPG